MLLDEAAVRWRQGTTLSLTGQFRLGPYYRKGQVRMRGTGNDNAHARMLLGAFILGGLSDHEATAVRAHLDVCAECKTEHDYLACVPGWLDLVRERTTPG